MFEILKVKQPPLQSNILNFIVELHVQNFEYVKQYLHYENVFSNIYMFDVLQIQNIFYNGKTLK